MFNQVNCFTRDFFLFTQELLPLLEVLHLIRNIDARWGSDELGSEMCEWLDQTFSNTWIRREA